MKLEMPTINNGWFVIPVLTVAAVGVLVWMKKRRTYKRVGYVSKILFFPMKSIQGIEVSEGRCTKFGLEVNGLMDRSFMLINEDKVYITLIEAPKLAQLTPKFNGSDLIISGPDVPDLVINLNSSPGPQDEIIECRLIGEVAYVIDCGEEASKWFQDYLAMPNIRMVRSFSNLPKRKCVRDHKFHKQIRSKYTEVSLQNLASYHILSQSSIDDLNERLEEKKASVSNFRPNILIDGCQPYSEDSWKFIRFENGVELVNVAPCTRCPLTTYDFEKGILTQKEPLTTLRKYRIPKDKEILKKLGSRACLGTSCFALKTGTVRLNEEIYGSIN